MNKKFLVKDIGTKQKIITNYLKDLFFDNDLFVKLTALDFLSNYIDDYEIKSKLEDLYSKETNYTLQKVYEEIFEGSYESSYQISKKKSSELSEESESIEDKRRLIDSLNKQLKYYKNKI